MNQIAMYLGPLHLGAMRKDRLGEDYAKGLNQASKD
jgi:hypothetical protein